MIFSKPKILLKTFSPTSGEIIVREEGEERALLVGGLIQSVNWDCPTVERRVWGEMVSFSDFFPIPPQKALILGLGGGTVASLLSKKFPEVEITAVEIDPEIVRVAREFFGLNGLKSIEVITGDAREFVSKQGKGVCDIVFVDTFCGENFCDAFGEEEFIRKIKELLKPGGGVVFNRISREGDNIQSFEETLARVFSKIRKKEVGGPSFFNLLFFAYDF